MKIDMHIHTKGSDGFGTPDQIAYWASERGMDAICITDHHKTYTKEGDEVAVLCEEVGIKVFRGCEYSTKNGHVLIFGIDAETLELDMYPEMQTVIDAVNVAGGVCIVSHPYHGYKYKCGELVYELDGLVALEGRNGQNEIRAPFENELAIGAAWDLDMPTTGGSDAHDPSYVGTCFTEFSGIIETEEELVEALKAGNYTCKRARKELGRMKEEYEAALARKLDAQRRAKAAYDWSAANLDIFDSIEDNQDVYYASEDTYENEYEPEDFDYTQYATQAYTR